MLKFDYFNFSLKGEIDTYILTSLHHHRQNVKIYEFINCTQFHEVFLISDKEQKKRPSEPPPSYQFNILQMDSLRQTLLLRESIPVRSVLGLPHSLHPDSDTTLQISGDQ